jgi:hypothetical protein
VAEPVDFHAYRQLSKRLNHQTKPWMIVAIAKQKVHDLECTSQLLKLNLFIKLDKILKKSKEMLN